MKEPQPIKLAVIDSPKVELKAVQLILTEKGRPIGRVSKWLDLLDWPIQHSSDVKLRICLMNYLAAIV